MTPTAATPKYFMSPANEAAANNNVDDAAEADVAAGKRKAEDEEEDEDRLSDAAVRADGGEDEGDTDDSDDDSDEANDDTASHSSTSGVDERGTANERVNSAAGRRGRSFSSVERALLLREVQILRFVDTEFLPSLATISIVSATVHFPPAASWSVIERMRVISASR